MTWLSRLLPQTRSLHHRSSPLHRTTKQRRRVMTLENLEQRVVLSDVSAMYMPGGILVIKTAAATTPVGPPAIFGNAFTIAESSAASGGTVKVSSNSLATTVNGVSGMGALAYTTPGPVTTIQVTVSAATPNPAILETIKLTGAGKTTPTTVKNVSFQVTTAKLALTVQNVDNSGTFTLNTNGGLDAQIYSSTFSAMTINQTSDACCGSVLLDNVNVAGAVNITEANAANDKITIQNGSTLGSTVLKQGNGAGDNITVVNSTVRDLKATQGNGAGDVIKVDTVKISSLGTGVVTTQGNGAGDTTTINAVTLVDNSLPPNFNPFQPIPLPGISVTQGTGDNDTAKVTNSNVPGDISITQMGGANDYAEVSASTAGFLFDLSMYGLGIFPINGNVNITQGSGVHTTALVSHVVANNVNVKQGDGDEDSASVVDSSVYGNVQIKQGNGGDIPNPPGDADLIGDVALVNNIQGRPGGATTGWVAIDQGSGNGDQATITNVNVGTDVSIRQRGGSNDFAGIGVNSSGVAGKVTAGGNVSITQDSGSNNTALIENIDPANITITQGPGSGNTATIASVTAAADVTISQGTGNYNTATIDDIGSADDVSITQALGDYNSATIENVAAATGNASIKQTGAHDSALIYNVNVENALNSSNPLLYFSNISITQSGGSYNTATIDDSTADGDLSITQDVTGLGTLDMATISNSSAGSVIHYGPVVIDLHGNASITQGNGYGVTATFTGLDVNNIYATQGDNVYDPNCDTGYYDTVMVDDSSVTSDIVIHQGGTNAVGGYFASIAYSSDVTAGGKTDIRQRGVGNYVVLGGGGSFMTNFLDVFTGTDFGTVLASQTTVFVGALGTYGPTTINGNGANNTYYDGGGNSGVTVAGNFNLS